MKLTMKDLFAMHAMQGILERGNGTVDPQTLSEQAYAIAFAMWEERGKLILTEKFNDSALEYPVDAVVQKREI